MITHLSFERRQKTVLDVNSLLTIQEAAEKVGVARATIYYWMQKDLLPFIQKGGTRLIKLNDLYVAQKLAGTTKRDLLRMLGEKK